MADIIPLRIQPKAKMYHIDITQFPDDLYFTINGIQVNKASLKEVADELERIAQIIRSDVMSGVVVEPIN